MSEIISHRFQDHARVIAACDGLFPHIESAATLASSSLMRGGKILLCGNGGSAADAQHMACELVGRFLKDRKALPAMALHTNTSDMTAIGNDFGFDHVYARQVEAFGNAGDVLIAISTSGNSQNVLEAASVAKSKGMAIIGLTGENGGKLKDHSDIWLGVPSNQTPRIQEVHILIGHILCELIENALA